jgi:hypothetical protein
VPHLCEFYPSICLTTEQKAWENLSQGKKNLSQVKKNLSHSTVGSAASNRNEYQKYFLGVKAAGALG